MDFNEKELNMTVRESMNEFAKYGFTMRYPDCRDGLKPIHRRILFTMHKMGLTPTTSFKKCANVVGQCMGAYHPHGDSSIYDALVKMAQPFSINYPPVAFSGNMGTVLDDPPAAYRYTECKLGDFSKTFLTDLSGDTIEFSLNYDGSELEPTVLPTMIPMILINGSFGIGSSAFNTSIPSHNLADVIDVTIDLIRNPLYRLEDIANRLMPDYPCGGVILNPEDITSFYKGGPSTSIKMEAKYYVDETSRCIMITELPYMVGGGVLRDEIRAKFPKLKDVGIDNIIDDVDDEGMKFAIYYTRNTNPGKLIDLLKQRTKMTNSSQLILSCVINGHLMENTDLKTILLEWITFRRDVVRRTIIHKIQKMMREQHVIEALVRLYDRLDEIIARIKKSQSREEVTYFLEHDYNLSVLQANAISGMKLYELSRRSKQEMVDRHEELKRLIEAEQDMLNDATVDNIIIEQMLEIKRKYGRPRRTEIRYRTQNVSTTSQTSTDLVLATCTGGNVGFIRASELAIPNKAKLLSGQRTIDLKSLSKYSTGSHALLAISNFGYIYRVEDVREEIERATIESKHWKVIPVKVSPRNGEEAISFIPVPKENLENGTGSIVVLCEHQTVKRVQLSELPARINRNGLQLVKCIGDDVTKPVDAWYIENSFDTIITSIVSGHLHAFKSEQLPMIGRNGKGMRLTASQLPVTNIFGCMQNDFIYMIRGDGQILVTEQIMVKHKRPGQIPDKVMHSGNISREQNRVIRSGRIPEAGLMVILKDGSNQFIPVSDIRHDNVVQVQTPIKSVLEI